MFYTLPVETVFEAKQRTRRATLYLFILLIGIYIFFANILALALYFSIVMGHGMSSPAGPVTNDGYAIRLVILNASFGAALLAVLHFWLVRNRPLDDLLDQLKASPADPRDTYHAQFINLVSEAEAATGIRGIRPVVLATPGCNAFSIQDGQGRCAIGATEGLLSRLNRNELSSVVAHEAAHLVHEDSRLVTTACFLFGIFGTINEMLGRAMTGPSYGSYDRRSTPREASFGATVVVLWLISGIGYFITKLVSMAISREREYQADADGVQMCKDPLAMAESLYKISRRYRGDIPDTFSALFILNPSDSDLDEQEGGFANLFSNHPPVSERLSKLLGWAKTDLQNLQTLAEHDEEASSPQASPAPPSGPTFMAYQENNWVGPYTPLQLLSMGFVNPSTWVCPVGGQQVTRASEALELLPLLSKQVQGAVSQNACPRCGVPLVTTHYEGAEVEQCSFCRGYLLRAGVLERLITRQDVTFSPQEIQKAKIWRDSQKGPLKNRNSFPDIKCPHCQNPMCKAIHSMLTQVVIDRCSNGLCGAIWCDGGELETIQMLVDDVHLAVH